jgi:hypothetical protein
MGTGHVAGAVDGAREFRAIAPEDGRGKLGGGNACEGSEGTDHPAETLAGEGEEHRAMKRNLISFLFSSEDGRGKLGGGNACEGSEGTDHPAETLAGEGKEHRAIKTSLTPFLFPFSVPANVAIGVEKRVVYIRVVSFLLWHRQHRAVFTANAHRGGRTFRGAVAQVIVSMVIGLVKDERLPSRPRPD